MKLDKDELKRRYEEIEREHSSARHDHALAKLFCDSGWSQQEIADALELSQQWISRLLRFARFLRITPTGVTRDELTERQFRDCWDQTDPGLNEDRRFREVARLLGVEVEDEPNEAQAVRAHINERLSERISRSDHDVKQFMQEIGCNTTASSTLSYIKQLLETGEPNVFDMVKRGEVGICAAAIFCTQTPRETQRSATSAAVKHEGNLIKKGHAKADDERAKTNDEREHKRKVRERNKLIKQRTIEATKAAIERARSRPKITDEEFERPPPELLHEEYPGRPGWTYASVHREQHGPVWINVSQKRRRDLVIKLSEIAREFSSHMEKIEILDERERATVFHRWRRALKPYLQEILTRSDVEEQADERTH
jgi:hypothetical protein